MQRTVGTPSLCDLMLSIKIFNQYLACLIFPLRWAYFPVKTSCNAQWVHLFSMDFDDILTIYLIFYSKSPFSMVELSLSGNTIYLLIQCSREFIPLYIIFIHSYINAVILKNLLIYHKIFKNKHLKCYIKGAALLCH